MTAEIDVPKLSPRVASILDIGGPPFGRPKLKGKELEEVRAVVRAAPELAGRLNVSHALFVLYDNDPSEESATSIGLVLADRQQDSALRRQAASVLGEAPTQAGAAALVDALAEVDTALEFTILASLVKVGERAAADAIARRPATTNARLAGMRRFACAAIAVREDQVPDSETEAALFPTGRAIELAPVPARRLKTLVKGLRGALFGIKPGTSFGFEVECAGTRHAILFDKALVPGKLIGQVMERRRAAGLVVMEEQGTLTWTARYAVFLKPHGDGAEVSVVRPNGGIALVGRLTREGEGFALRLRDLGGGGLPLEVEGTLTDQALRLRARTFDDSPAAQSPGLAIAGD